MESEVHRFISTLLANRILHKFEGPRNLAGTLSFKEKHYLDQKVFLLNKLLIFI